MPTGESPEPAVASSVDAEVIPTTELNSIENSALGGDPDAALRMALHHEGLAGASEEAMFWHQVAAENGNFTAMQHLAVLMQSKGEARLCRRAQFWLRRIQNEADSQVVLELRVRSTLDEFVSRGCEPRRD